MKRAQVWLWCGLGAVALAAAGFYAGRHSGPTGQGAMSAAAPASAASAAGDRKVLYWHDPMVPGPRFDKPGKSPFMDMQLVPVYADEASDSGVKVSPTVQQNLGLRTATLRRSSNCTEPTASNDALTSARRTAAVRTPRFC